MIVRDVMAFNFGDGTKHISALSGKKQNFPNGATGVMQSPQGFEWLMSSIFVKLISSVKHTTPIKSREHFQGEQNVTEHKVINKVKI